MGCGLKLWVPWSKLHRNHTVFFSSSQPIPKLHTFWGHQTWLLRGFSKAFQSPGTKFEVYSISGKIIGHWGFLLLQWDGREATLKSSPSWALTAKHGGFMVELIAMINGHCRNRLIGGTDSIYKSYFLGNIPRKSGLKNGMFTYLHLLDPGFPIDVMWFLIAHW